MRLCSHFEVGGAFCRILEGESLEEVMYRAYWKSPKTAMYYTKDLEVMFPWGFSWGKIEVDRSKNNYNQLDAIPSLFEEKFWRVNYLMMVIWEKGIWV